MAENVCLHSGELAGNTEGKRFVLRSGKTEQRIPQSIGKLLLNAVWLAIDKTTQIKTHNVRTVHVHV